MKVKHPRWWSNHRGPVVALWSKQRVFCLPCEMCGKDSHFQVKRFGKWDPTNGSRNLFLWIFRMSLPGKTTHRESPRGEGFAKTVFGFYLCFLMDGTHKHWAKWNDQTINLTFFNVEDGRETDSKMAWNFLGWKIIFMSEIITLASLVRMNYYIVGTPKPCNSR